jgi:hypothetical protein
MSAKQGIEPAGMNSSLDAQILTRAWKPSTFSVGLAWLLWGAAIGDYPDWDYGVSLLMAGSTYFSADWVVRAIMERRYLHWPLAALLTWWCVDGSYWLYWSLVRPEVLIREGQWLASLCLFLLCGFVWRLDPRSVWAALARRPQ